MNKRMVKEFFVYGFATYGVIWTLIESASYFLEFEKGGRCQYLLMIVISIGVGLWRSWPKSSISISVPNSDSSIVIEFGDIFKHDGYIALPVNEFFDSQLGNHVSPNSLHGAFIQNVLGGQSGSFDLLIEQSLNGQPFTEEVRQSGKLRKYPIGTTAPIEINSKKYFMFALTHTNTTTLKASATVHELWDALAGLWESIRNYSNGYVVAVPLAGGGLSGVGLPPKNLLDIIVMSFFYYTKKNKITHELKLILPSELKSKIDLVSYSQNWS